MNNELIDEYAQTNLSHMDRVAWRKAGSIPGWEPFSWEVVDHEAETRDVIVQGSIPRELKTGKNKGRKTWREETQLRKVVVTGAEIKAEMEAYSKATGNCATCHGKGEVVKSWCKIEGTKYRPCSKCDGTGKAAL